MFLLRTTSLKVYLSLFFLLTLLSSLAESAEKNSTKVHGKFEYDERYIFLREINAHSNRTHPNDHEVPSSIFPYVVALLDNNKKIQCSGTIISPTHILTAAHCAKLSYVYYAGKEDEGNYLQVIRYIQHPFFSYKYVKTRRGKSVTRLKNDIAIVTTYDSLLTNGGRPIAVNVEMIEDVVRRIGTGLGYGRRNNEDLTKIRFTDVELDSCFEHGWTHTICGITPIYNLFSSGICSGDSGGPLVYEGNLLGIGILGQAECGADVDIEEVLIVYTLVSAYKDWIQNVTKIQLNNF